MSPFWFNLFSKIKRGKNCKKFFANFVYNIIKFSKVQNINNKITITRKYFSVKMSFYFFVALFFGNKKREKFFLIFSILKLKVQMNKHQK